VPNVIVILSLNRGNIYTAGWTRLADFPQTLQTDRTISFGNGLEMPTTRRKRKEQELHEDDSEGELEVFTNGDKLDLTLHFSLDASLNVDTSELQAALPKTVSEYTTSKKLTNASPTTNDTYTSTKESNGPCTAKGVPIPTEITNMILGHLKSDRQIRSLTAFQQCSREAYRLARPFVYSDLFVSLLGLRKIRMCMHLPTEGLDYKWHKASKKDKKSVADEAWAALSVDGEEGKKAVENLENGNGDVWYGLDATKRL
jgi:hypothetical protein